MDCCRCLIKEHTPSYYCFKKKERIHNPCTCRPRGSVHIVDDQQQQLRCIDHGFQQQSTNQCMSLHNIYKFAYLYMYSSTKYNFEKMHGAGNDRRPVRMNNNGEKCRWNMKKKKINRSCVCAVETSASRVPHPPPPLPKKNKKQQGNMSKGRRAKKVVDVDSAMKKGTICPPNPNTPQKRLIGPPPFLYVCYTIKQQLLLLTMRSI